MQNPPEHPERVSFEIIRATEADAAALARLKFGNVVARGLSNDEGGREKADKDISDEGVT